MTSSIAAVQAQAVTDALSVNEATPRAPATAYHAFSTMLMQGIDHVSETSAKADALVTAFALDDSVPPHQVMFALEQAHDALAMMMQVRSRLTEGYQEIMRMQL